MQGVFFFVFSNSVGLFYNGRTGLELLRNKAFDDVGQYLWLVMVQHMTSLNNLDDFNLRDRAKSFMGGCPNFCVNGVKGHC